MVAATGISLGELAVRFGCTLRGDPHTVVRHVGTLESADATALAFLANPKYRAQLTATRAAAVVLEPAAAADCPTAALLTPHPYATYARIAVLLHPPEYRAAGIHPSAAVDATANIDSTAHIGPHVTVGAGAKVGARAVVGPGCVVGDHVQVGADTRLLAKVTVLERVVIGERCIVNSGAVIGSEGFGFAPEHSGWLKVPQVGGVMIGNDVEIGANTTIDRGAIDDTVIEDGVKLDNQIQIAHNVRIGAHTAIAACSGISGSTTIGKRCMIAGMVGIVGHISICDDVIITGKSMVSSSIRKPGMYSGTLPLDEAKLFRRNAARFRQLDRMAQELRRLGGKLGRDGSEEN